jgi:hypothetical protein
MRDIQKLSEIARWIILGGKRNLGDLAEMSAADIR